MPISPMPSAARLSPRRSSCSPAQTRSAAAPPGMWQLSLSQEIGLSKPCSSYSSVWAKSLAIRENSSSSISMPLRRRTSRSPSSVPDTSPPHPRLMLRVYEHLFVGQGLGEINFVQPSPGFDLGLRADPHSLFPARKPASRTSSHQLNSSPGASTGGGTAR